jgi:D-inositol-3-phosphate glycosyltransferase
MVDVKVRMLVISDAVVPTGFGNVMHGIVGNLPKEEYDIKWLGINYRGDPHPYNLEIYPATLNSPQDIYGTSRLAEFKAFKPHIIFLLNDAWIIDMYLKHIKEIFKEQMPKIVTYIPVDAMNHDHRWYNDFDVVTELVAYTQFGKKVIDLASGNKVTKVIQHGVDFSKFFKMKETRAEIRMKNLGGSEKLKDSFIMLNANRNQPRKRLDTTIEAFAMFSADKPEDSVKLMMHCGTRDSHIDVIEYAHRCGVDKNLILTGNVEGVRLDPIERLNVIYNSADVGLNTGMGEGWGLTNHEHGITGAAQIVGNHSSLHELFMDNRGFLVPGYLGYTQDIIMTKGVLLKPEDVAVKMEEAYSNPKLREKISANFITTYGKEEYTWQYIGKKWHELFVGVMNK